jgi:uncharacterized protein (TIGR02600 family)
MQRARNQILTSKFLAGMSRPCFSTTPHRRPSSDGMALVIVLAFLVLLSVLVIAFLSSVTTELTSAKSYAAGTNARQLADSSVQTVMGQIRDATTKGSKLAWASQPGMIRTYDDVGEPVGCYKLYSSENMVVTKSQIQSYTPGSDVDPAWNTKPGLYADLNTPVLVSDPASPTQTYPVFSIIDPRAAGTGSNSPVEGFSYGNKVPAGDVGGVIPVSTSTDNTARLPMPVRWLYVLKDGTLTAPTDYDVSKQTATWVGAPAYKKPSDLNPIVGRIAFWTDDETCKININTASEPTPWDTPRAISVKDLAYGKYQPAQNEFQRFPGHPYSTALSPVFFPNTVLTLAQKQAIYEAVPRIAWGGSKAATQSVGGIDKVTLDSDRLFASVDEFLFKPDRSLNTMVDAEALKRSRFFLTANSRAPEVNLFGLPRISIWPVPVVPSVPQFRSPYDSLSAFCATIPGANPAAPQTFYFQRSDATSDTTDWTLVDYSGQPRNQMLYAYLQALTDRDIPGFGGKFSSVAKWGADRDQVLTEIFDYVRCANLKDPQVTTPFSANGQVTPIKITSKGPTTMGFGRVYMISQVGYHFICGQDNSTSTPQGDNAGAKKITLQNGEKAIEAALLFEPFTVSPGYRPLGENLSYEVTFTNRVTLDGKDLEFPTTPVTVSSNNLFSVGWNFRWGEASPGLRGPIMSFGGGSYPLVGKKRVAVSTAAGKKTMAFSAGAIRIKAFTQPGNVLVQTYDFDFPGGTFPIPDLVTTGTQAHWAASSSPASLWWNLSTRYAQAGKTAHIPGAEYPDPKRRFGNDTANNPPGFKIGGLFRQEDVVRSIVPEHGDLRLVAARTEPLKDVKFVPVGEWKDEQQHFYHIFTEPIGARGLYGFANEPPVAGLTYSTSAAGDQLTPADYHFSRMPEINAGAGKLYNQWNDFDTGVAQVPDGSFISKPDEGNVSDTQGGYPYFSWYFVAPAPVYFSPNRVMKSPAMFGSLPTGVKRNQPWQTLLFRPQANHPGNGTPISGPPYTAPPDHLIMDLFWMPVVEPYAISEPFSTAGKVNLNYEIAPFSYIRRATALHAVLKGEEPLAIPNALSRVHKLWDHETSDWPWLPNNPDPRACQDAAVASLWDEASKGTGSRGAQDMRKGLDAAETLKQCDDYFKTKGIFRSATQICELHLVRTGESLTDYQSGSFWSKNVVTGENSREAPYANLYARLTTKSNTYTVHMRVQVLKQKASANPDDFTIWREGTDQVVSEFRGATLLERYLDTGAQFPDLTANPGTDSVEDSYKFRIISTKRFVP